MDASSDLVSALRVERPDVCFNALHGKLGEDGTVQSLLEFVGVPFVGSPSSVCRRAWDKSSLGSEMAAYRAITGDEPTASWPQASASRARRSRAWALRRRLTWWKTA